VLAGVALGAAGGYAIAASIVRLRERRLMIEALDGWVAVAAALLVYGLTEVAGAYGFLAAFAAGVAFRNYEHGHEMNRSVHHGAEVVEKFCELGLILLLGSMITVTGMSEVGAAGWLLVAALLFVIRSRPRPRSPSPARGRPPASARSSAGSAFAASVRCTTWPSRSDPASCRSTSRGRCSGPWPPASSPRSSCTA